MAIKFIQQEDSARFGRTTGLMEDAQFLLLRAAVDRIAANWKCSYIIDGEAESDMFLAVEGPNMILFSIRAANKTWGINGGIYWDGKEWSVHT